MEWLYLVIGIAVLALVVVGALLVGVLPGTDATLPAAKATARRVHAWWNELGFPAEDLHTAVTLTPACGLAGATPGYARAAMTHLREAARYLQPE